MRSMGGGGDVRHSVLSTLRWSLQVNSKTDSTSNACLEGAAKSVWRQCGNRHVGSVNYEQFLQQKVPFGTRDLGF